MESTSIDISQEMIPQL